MFAAGYYVRSNWDQQSVASNIVKISVALLVASSIAFFISNGSYYVLSGKFADLSWAEYASRVDKYFFKSISRPVFYVSSAIAIDLAISYFYKVKHAKRLAQ